MKWISPLDQIPYKDELILIYTRDEDNDKYFYLARLRIDAHNSEKKFFEIDERELPYSYQMPYIELKNVIYWSKIPDLP